MSNDRYQYLGASWEEEQKARAWEALPPADKAAQIEQARLDRLHWGICQACGFRIEATGAAWPSKCPRCNHGSSQL